ncbi:MAG: hypothetical protein J07HB67_01951 [halophilic archaeon J07HB67]|jgi:hypothetical protein|nr:MAG: hypothetical protein J07HB67_01951 [halophilic archaeon J07HB67]
MKKANAETGARNHQTVYSPPRAAYKTPTAASDRRREASLSRSGTRWSTAPCGNPKTTTLARNGAYRSTNGASARDGANGRRAATATQENCTPQRRSARVNVGGNGSSTATSDHP